MHFPCFLGWLLGHCYAVAKVFLVVARAILCSILSVMGGC